MGIEARIAVSELNARISSPTARSIASAVARMIRDEELHTGDVLPRVRDLAASLRVSPSTISEAWTMLRERGLIVGRGKSGTRVSSPAELSPHASFPAGAEVRHDLRYVLPDSKLLPSLEKALLSASSLPGLSNYDKSGISPVLEDAVHAVWAYSCDQFVAASGAVDGLWLALRALSVPGDRVLLESPGSPPLIRVVRRLGLIPVELESDVQGPLAESLRSGLKSDPIALVYQPRAQVPTGRVTSRRRIGELAEVVAPSRCAVIEFDDIGDLSMVPNRSMGTHLRDQTVIVKSFEKSYGPDLRMAVIGGSNHFVGGLHGHMLLERQWTSRILQGALAWLLTDEATQEGMLATRVIYRRRLEKLARALGAEGLVVEARDGLCAWIPVWSEKAAVASAAAHGVLVYPGSYSYPSSKDGYVRVAVSRLTRDYEEVAQIIGRAAEAM